MGKKDKLFLLLLDDCIDLTLYKKTDGTPPNESQQIWISAGTVAGGIPEGLDPFYGKYLADSGSGNAWVEVNIDGNTGEIVSVAVDGGGSTPQNTNTSETENKTKIDFNLNSLGIIFIISIRLPNFRPLSKLFKMHKYAYLN